MVSFMATDRWPEVIWEMMSGLGYSDARENVIAFGRPIHLDEDDTSLIHAGMVVLDRKKIRKVDVPLVAAILHELLHVFGRTHADTQRFSATIMGADFINNKHVYPYLGDLDVRALRAVYGEW